MIQNWEKTLFLILSGNKRGYDYGVVKTTINLKNKKNVEGK